MNLADVYQAYARTHATIGAGCCVHADCLENPKLAIACEPNSGLWKAIGVRRAVWPVWAIVVPCVKPYSSAVPIPETRVALPVEVHTFHHDLFTPDWIGAWMTHPTYIPDIPPTLGSLGLPRYYPILQDLVAIDWDLYVYLLRPLLPRLPQEPVDP